MSALETHPLDRAELLDSLRATLARRAPGAPLWIFAYGSLMWNPDFRWDPRHVATLRGYHRSFRVWSRHNRGTPANPGLVLTLECGGSCRGLVYRMRDAAIDADMPRVWEREMSFGSYRPKWLGCNVGGEVVRALTFTVNRECAGYAGRIAKDTMVAAIASAKGRYGPAHEYLFRTREILAEHGIRDGHVEELAHLVRRRILASA